MLFHTRCICEAFHLITKTRKEKHKYIHREQASSLLKDIKKLRTLKLGRYQVVT